MILAIFKISRFDKMVGSVFSFIHNDEAAVAAAIIVPLAGK
jgi:hypothetical protein